MEEGVADFSGEVSSCCVPAAPEPRLLLHEAGKEASSSNQGQLVHGFQKHQRHQKSTEL